MVVIERVVALKQSKKLTDTEIFCLSFKSGIDILLQKLLVSF